MVFTQKTVSEMQKSACLIDYPQGTQYQRNIGTGFFIKDCKNNNIFYFLITNHNLNYILFDTEKPKLYGDNIELDCQFLSRKLDDFFISYPLYNENGELIRILTLPSLFIESIIIPNSRYKEDSKTEASETDFCIFKINFEKNKQIISHKNILIDPNQIKLEIQKLCYQDFNLLNDKLNLKLNSNKEYIEKYIISRDGYASLTGFPIEKTNIDYLDDKTVFMLEYSTMFAKIIKTDNTFIEFTAIKDKKGQTPIKLSEDINGLSGSPLLSRILIQETPDPETVKFDYIVLGMCIEGVTAISIEYLQKIIKDKTKTTEITNPTFGQLIIEQ